MLQDLAYDSYNGLVLDDSEGKHLASQSPPQNHLRNMFRSFFMCFLQNSDELLA